MAVGPGHEGPGLHAPRHLHTAARAPMGPVDVVTWLHLVHTPVPKSLRAHDADDHPAAAAVPQVISGTPPRRGRVGLVDGLSPGSPVVLAGCEPDGPSSLRPRHLHFAIHTARDNFERRPLELRGIPDFRGFKKNRVRANGTLQWFHPEVVGLDGLNLPGDIGQYCEKE